MSERKLKFTARFMKESDSLEPYVSEANTFFNNLESKMFNFSLVSKKVVQCMNGFNSDSSLYDLCFILNCSNVKRDSDVSNFCSTINKQWCNESNENDYLHWLISDCNNFIPMNYNSHYGNARTFDFSFGTMPNMKTYVKQYTFSQKEWVSTILCSFSHLQRHFSLFISNLHTPECKHKGEMGHKIVIMYDSVLRLVANMDPSKEVAELFFYLEHPPFLYVSHAGSQTDEVDTIFKNRISKAKELENGCGKFERTFSLGCKCNNTWCTSKKIGYCPVLKISIGDKFQTRWLVEQLIHRCGIKTEICFSYLKTKKIVFAHSDLKRFPLTQTKHKLSEIEKFNCEYAWKVANSRSLSIKHEIALKNKETPNYLDNLKLKLCSSAQENPPAVCKTLFFIADMIDKGTMFSFKSTFENKFKYFCSFSELTSIPPGMCYVRRIILTPSRTLFLRPYEHFDNRIIRKFGVEYMLRVSIQDDNFSKFTFAVQYNSNKEDIMSDIVGNVLKSGFIVGSRKYELLAASTSQLREHGLWLYAPDPQNNTSSSIRQWMGDFSSIKNVAKYMARMGQCFSSTEEGVQICLNKDNECPLKDITSPDGRYTFSDGIGVISSTLADEIRSVMNQKYSQAVERHMQYHPVAFQIRYKGCKGMVAENPNIEGRTIRIRPSMEKFECNSSNHLEIVKTSAPTRLFLNKHLITILEQMGVPKETFLDLQSDMMLKLLDALVDETVAASFLSHNLNSMFYFRSLLSAGFSLTTEPFFRSLLLGFFKIATAKLRSSMRIAVPEKHGRNMLGILDETKSLKYGQVFVQYSESTNLPNSSLHIVTGDVIVTKNPSLHPGDVRKLVAVDIPKLHYIKDCIVFPAEGERPHPDEMAGSDLDGDEYVVIWYKPLIFSQENVKPMEYPIYPEIPLERKINVSDMIDFFCHYIQNDCIGAFAHAHLVWADKLEDGIFSSKCMKIAERYPYVLDFAKHGTTKYLKKSERPDQYPDFMQKGLTGNSYHSERALGSLYRSSRVLDACSSKINLASQSSTFDEDLIYPGWEQYKDSATQHKNDYSNMILEILNKYSLKSEAEAFSGFIELEISKRWRQESNNAVKVIKCYIENIMLTFRNIFTKEVTEEAIKLKLGKKEAEIKKFQRASAWYMCLYGKNSECILSFPWILSDILAEMKEKKALLSLSRNFLSDIDYDIQQCVLNEDNNNIVSQTICRCKNPFKAIVFAWLFKSGLNIWSKENKSCINCSERILSYFLLNSGISCCSSSKEASCTCSESCSSTKLFLQFLKFFIKRVYISIGECKEGCHGFVSRNLQELSLQALAYLSITRNVKCLGLQTKTSNTFKNSVPLEEGNMFEEEGEPIRIPVKTDLLKTMIEGHSEEVTNYLKKKSGVKHIVLHPEAHNRDNYCLIVNSIGKNFERWNLETILLHPKFTENLKIALQFESC